MKKRNIYIAVTSAVLILAVILTGIFSDGFKRFLRPKDQIIIPSLEDPASMLLYGCSEAPYKTGDIIFRSNADSVFRYYVCRKDGEIPEIEEGFNASSWTEISDGDIISDTDCRNIMLVTTDQHGYVTSSKLYSYVPGIIYGESNPDQYDDLLFYNKEDPSLEEDRAVRLASNLFRSGKTSYYGTEYGYIVQGYLTTYSHTAGLLEGYLHTGVDINTRSGRPFYSPVNGKIIYAGENDDYNTIIIYDEENDISLLILHGENVTPADTLFKNGGEVKIGDLLGYGGSAGEPDGDTHLHLELQGGKASKYQSFSKKSEYTRINNYDPLIIADLYGLEQLTEDSFENFDTLGTNAFNAQNNGCTVLVGNWLYYINSTDNTVCASRPDGSERKVLASCRAKNLNYADGWLYYSNLDEAGHLMKTACDGSASAKIAESDTSDFVLAVNDWLYYSSLAENGSLYAIRFDGTEKKLMRRGDIQSLFYHSGNFYYTLGTKTKSERIRRFNVTTGEDTLLTGVRTDTPFIYNSDLCFRIYYPDKNCFKAPLSTLDTGNATPLIPAAYYNVFGGERYIIFTNVNDGASLYIFFPERSDEGVYKLTDDTLCSDMAYNGGWLYYHTNRTGNGTDLCRINIQSLRKQILSNETGLWEDIAIECDENVYRLVKDNRVHTITAPDSTPIPEEDPSGNKDNVAPITPPPEEPTDTPVPEEPSDETPPPEGPDGTTEEPTESPEEPTETPEAPDVTPENPTEPAPEDTPVPEPTPVPEGTPTVTDPTPTETE